MLTLSTRSKPIILKVRSKLFYFFSLLLLSFSCLDIPTDPNNPSNSTIQLLLHSSTGLKSDQLIIDSVGKEMKIIIAYKYPEFIKSTVIEILNSKNEVEFEKNIVTTSTSQYDTVRVPYKFTSNGDKRVIAKAYIQNGDIKIDTALCTIFSPSIANSAPELHIAGIKTVTAGDLCSLTVTIEDRDIGQVHATTVKHDLQTTTLTNNQYIWRIPADAANETKLLFSVTDNGTPPLTDTETVILTVNFKVPDPPQNVHIESRTSSALILTWEGSSRAQYYAVYRSDNSSTGFSLYADSLTSTSFSDSKLSGNHYYYVKAINKAGSSAQSNIVSSSDIPNKPVDSLPPVIKLQDIDKDSIITVSTTFQLSMNITDQSGIAIVECSSGSKLYPVQNAGKSNYNCTINDLLVNQFTTITIIATDSANTANKTTKLLFIKSDPTLNDHTGPSIQLVSPSKDSSKVSSPDVPVTVVCSDSSGIASISCVVGSKEFTATKGVSNNFTFNISGLTQGINKLKFTAIDSSSNKNFANKEVIIIYDPTMADNVPPIITLKNPALNGARVLQDSLTITIVCKDNTGIESVTGSRAGQEITVTNIHDSVYVAPLTNLTAGRSDTITFTAKDNSTNKNSDSLKVIVKYNTKIEAISAVVPVINATGIALQPTFKWTGGNDPDGDEVYFIVRYGISLANLSNQTSETVNDSIKLFASSSLEPYTKYYWQVIAYSKTYNDSTRSSVGSFTTIGVAPSITSSPSVQTLKTGETLTLVVKASGIPAPDQFQWYQNNTAIINATTATYTKANVSASDAGSYHVVVLNGVYPEAKSTAVQVTVITPPEITKQPDAKTAVVGEAVTFSVTASGTAPLSYQWKQNGTNITGAALDSLAINSIAVTHAGSYSVVVSNGAGNVESNNVVLTVVEPPKITTQPQSQDISVGKPVTFTIVAAGTPPFTYQWLKHGFPITEAISSSYTIPSVAIADSNDYSVRVINSVATVTSELAVLRPLYAIKIAAGYEHSLVLKNDGTVWACGGGYRNQLGNGIDTLTTTPIKVNISDVRDISAGSHSLFLKRDGTAWACGYNGIGELGVGDDEPHSTPVQVSISGIITAISAGSEISMFLKSDGIVWACGDNEYGQTGTQNDRSSVPLQVKITGTVTAIAATSEHSIFLKSDGTVWACGYDEGYLGTGHTSSIYEKETIPVQISENGQFFSKISAGNYFSLLGTEYQVYACGKNSNGQLSLGSGSATTISSPVQTLVNGTNLAFSAGTSHSLFLDRLGAVTSSGSNQFGELGNGPIGSRFNAGPVTIEGKLIAIAAGNNFSLFLRSDGTVWGTGKNSSGQLGTGNRIDVSVPVQMLLP